jgi:hypothetical protein
MRLLTSPITILPSRTLGLQALRFLVNHMSRLQALHHPRTHISRLRRLPLRPYHILRLKALLQSYMPSHTPQARALRCPLDHTPQAQALALLFLPLTYTLLPRAPFLRRKHTQRPRSHLPSSIQHLSNQLNHMSHLRVLSYLRTFIRPFDRRLPSLSSRTCHHRTPHSRCRCPLLPCLHTARHMHPGTLPLFLYRPSQYRGPRQTILRLTRPHPILLTTNQICRILT